MTSKTPLSPTSLPYDAVTLGKSPPLSVFSLWSCAAAARPASLRAGGVGGERLLCKPANLPRMTGDLVQTLGLASGAQALRGTVLLWVRCY